MTTHAEPSALGYFVFEASDLPAWQRFAVDIVGMQPGQCDPADALALRLDDYEQRVLIERGDADDLVAVGWETDTEEELEALAERVRSHGVAVQAGSPELAERRKVRKLYTCTDPNGLTHELYYGPAVAPLEESFRSKVMRAGFVAGRLGAGHYVAIAGNADETNRFYHQVLGLRISDYIRGEVAPGGPVLDATFYHAATGRHHSVATAEMPLPKKLHHFMVQVEDMNDVGLAHDRCKRAGVPFFMDLGHHPNDQMFSFYVQTPSGFGLEIGWGGIVIDEDEWEVRTYRQLSDWGHESPQAAA